MEAPRKNAHPERDLQRAIVALLRRGYPHIVYNAATNEAQARETDEAKRMRFGAARKASGVTSGWPDLTLALPGGRTLYLELKAPKGRVSEAQEYIHARLRSLGHQVEVVRSVEEVQQLLHGANVFQHRPVQPLHRLSQEVPL